MSGQIVPRQISSDVKTDYTAPLAATETHTITVGAAQRGFLHKLYLTMGNPSANGSFTATVAIGGTTVYQHIGHINGTNVPEQARIFPFELPAGCVLAGEAGDNIVLTITPNGGITIANVRSTFLYELDEVVKGN